VRRLSVAGTQPGAGHRGVARWARGGVDGPLYAPGGTAGRWSVAGGRTVARGRVEPPAGLDRRRSQGDRDRLEGACLPGRTVHVGRGRGPGTQRRAAFHAGRRATGDRALVAAATGPNRNDRFLARTRGRCDEDRDDDEEAALVGAALLFGE